MHETNGVRITNAEIYNKVLSVETKVNSVEQSMNEIVKPTLNDHSRRLGQLEIRVYSILAGFVAAALGAKGIGLI